MDQNPFEGTKPMQGEEYEVSMEALNNYLKTKRKTTMKGIYLTEQGKAAIEAEMAQLEKTGLVREHHITQYEVYKKILSSAIVLPAEKSWSKVGRKSCGAEYAISGATQEMYPNGVIIQPEQP